MGTGRLVGERHCHHLARCLVQGLPYFRNPKLQAKVAIVVLLTLNGYLLHKAVLPALQRAGSLLHLPLGSRMLAVFAGVVSGVSWFYAAMLGIGQSVELGNIRWLKSLPRSRFLWQAALR